MDRKGTTGTLEDSLAAFLAELGPHHLGDGDRKTARRLIADQLAVQIGGVSLPWSRIALRMAAQGTRPEATIVGSDRRADAQTAAFVNAVYGHSFEYDDTHAASNGHPGAVVIPTALALGEATGASFEDVLVAIVAGYEVYTRIGMLAAPDMLNAGYHPHGVLSAFGAAAVAARLKKLPQDLAFNVLGIAASFCSGTLEFASTGGTAKRFHGSIGIDGGLKAVALAQAGIVPPTRFLTGVKGFYRTFARKTVDPDITISTAPEDGFQIHQMWLKAHCCCGAIQPIIDALASANVAADDIEGIEVRLQNMGETILGDGNTSRFDPRDSISLQMSLPYQLAFHLAGLGNGFAPQIAFTEGTMPADVRARLDRLAPLVRTRYVPELDERHRGRFVGDLTVTTKSGQRIDAFVPDAVGTPANPMDREALARKALDMLVPRIGGQRAQQLLEAIESWPGAAPVAGLMEYAR